MSRLIGKLWILLAVLLMPLGMAPATAARHESTPAASMPMEHCPQQGAKHDGKAGFVECTMACSAALPAADASGQRPLLIARPPTERAGAQILHGLHPETATPPPRLS